MELLLRQLSSYHELRRISDVSRRCLLVLWLEATALPLTLRQRRSVQSTRASFQRYDGIVQQKHSTALRYSIAIPSSIGTYKYLFCLFARTAADASQRQQRQNAHFILIAWTESIQAIFISFYFNIYLYMQIMLVVQEPRQKTGMWWPPMNHLGLARPLWCNHRRHRGQSIENPFGS